MNCNRGRVTLTGHHALIYSLTVKPFETRKTYRLCRIVSKLHFEGFCVGSTVSHRTFNKCNVVVVMWKYPVRLDPIALAIAAKPIWQFPVRTFFVCACVLPNRFRVCSGTVR